jgi:PilX N-terminal
MRGDEAGAALVLVLLLTVLVAALASAMLVLVNLEVVLAGNQRDGAEALYAAEAALEFSVDELSRAPDWTAVLAGVHPATMVDSTMTPRTEFAGVADLLAMTSDVQRQTDARAFWGANSPQWRLFASGPLRAIAPVAGTAGGIYLVAWVSDDVAETDGNPWADGNGVVRVRAEAFGRRGARRAVEAVVGRTGVAGASRLISWRAVR